MGRKKEGEREAGNRRVEGEMGEDVIGKEREREKIMWGKGERGAIDKRE